MSGNKRKALSKTPSKIIVNMDIAVEALNKTDITNLHIIIHKLNLWDKKYQQRFGEQSQEKHTP